MAGSGMNVLLVMLDSVRADRVACYGDERAHTPTLDALAAEGVRFSNVVSESTWTLPVSSTIFTGLTPREHRMEASRKLAPAVPTLPALLRDAGYATFGASNNPFIGADTGLAAGFDTFYVPRERGFFAHNWQRHVTRPLGRADCGAAAALGGFRAWLRRAAGPWFATLWINDAHHPYRVPRWTQARSAEAPLSWWQRQRLTDDLRHARRVVPTPQTRSCLESLYANAVTYVDSVLARVLAAVAAGGFTDHTLLLVAADHGDMLGERGLMGHGAAAGMYQDLIHVPLLMRGPDIMPAVAPALVQLADLTETIAAVAGVAEKLAPTAVERVDLRHAAHGMGRTAAFCERDPLSEVRLRREKSKAPRFDFAPHQCEMTAVVSDGWKLIERRPGASELYHVADDPDEARDLLAEQPRRAEYLRSLIADFHARATSQAGTSMATDDAEIVDQRLKDLGYL